MKINDYFGEWIKVIDKNELFNIINKLNKLYAIKPITPEYQDIFKVFTLCPYDKCRVIFIGMDPYPQKNIATGIAFGNKVNTLDKNLSPSLQVIKNSIIDLYDTVNNINFDPTLESWAKQGVLLLNSALTVEINKPGSHIMLWRSFIASLLTNISLYNTGIIYVLFGKAAQTFIPYIGKNNTIIKECHPSYYHRLGINMPYRVFSEVNNILTNINNDKIKWYEEIC
ncbi:MAG: uracil-DNA glycosylase [Clostridium sp.]